LEIYFFRHADAGNKEAWSGPDRDRPLSAEGVTQARHVAEALSGLRPGIPLIVSSPLVRARQTAEIAAETLGCAERLADDERLAHGFDRRSLAALVAEHAGARVLLLVGHEPDFSATIAEVTGGTVTVKKAGVARIDFDEQTTRGTLVWLLPPRPFVHER